MITVKQFKTEHGLSDSAFKRLVNKAKEAYPGGEFTRRVGSTRWEVLQPEILESLLPTFSEAEPEPFTCDGENVAINPCGRHQPRNGSGNTIASNVQIQPLNLAPLQFQLTPLFPSGSDSMLPTEQVSTLNDLNDRSDQLMSVQSEVEMALQVVEQTRALVGYVLGVQREQVAIEEDQVTQLEDAAFELQVHADCLRREDRRVSIEGGYRSHRRQTAHSNVVTLRDFFDRRTVAHSESQPQ